MKTLKRDGSLEMAFDRMMLKLEEMEKLASKKDTKEKNSETKTKKSTKKEMLTQAE
jgi:hypothetical protein